MTNFILIDGSYYIFYRYYAILQWYKCSHKGVKLENPSKNTEFVEKFRTTFVSKLEEIPQKLKIENPIVLVGKDCPREKIWRMQMVDCWWIMSSVENLHPNGKSDSLLYPYRFRF